MRAAKLYIPKERNYMTTTTPDQLSPRYKPLTEQQLDRIHDATMEVLAETGFEVHNPEAFELFRKVASEVDTDNRVIKLSESTVREIIAQAPSKVTLHGRDETHDCALGTGNVYFGTGGTALNILDYPDQTVRPAHMDDLIDIVRIADQLEYIHLMLLPTYPNELGVDDVDINRFYAGFMYTTKHIMGGVYTSKGISDVIAMAERIAGSPEALRERPFLSMITCGISPLRLDEKYGAFMMQVARSGIPAIVPAEPLCGATAPMSLAGNLVIQNCDALINVMLTQLVNPGTPVVYGCVASATDLRDVSYLGGPVESGLLNAATAQMTKYYGLPYYATAGISDAKVLDAQCGYESAINNLLVAMAGADFIHDAAGLMEFAMTVSKEKIVIDNEILGMALRACRGIEINDETLALDVIKSVGPGGNFLTSRHTRKHMRKEHYSPRLSDRDKRPVWEAQGAQDTPGRAHEIVRRFVSSRAKTYLPEPLQQELNDRFPSIVQTPHREAVKA